jgi:MFS family permease
LSAFNISVPILPDFLASFSPRNISTIPSSVLYKNFDLHYIPNSITKHPVAGNTKNASRDVPQYYFAPELNELNVETENGKVGLLLAMKAFMQLLFNPIIGNFSSRFGYKAIIFFGTINLLLSSLCETFFSFFD